MTPRITIIVPAYNNQDIIGRCLDHVFALDPPADEVIVVNDGSTDQTAQVAQNYPCTIHHLAEHSGTGFARHQGVELAHNDIVAFLDSDCLVPKDWISKIRHSLSAEIIGVGGKYDLPAQMPLVHKLFLTFGDFKNVLYRKRQNVAAFPGGNCAFWRRELLKPRPQNELQYFQKRAGGEDIVMCCELAEHGPLVFDPDLRVVHDKKTSLAQILKKTFWYGYTGAVFLYLGGRRLSREPYRRYRFLIMLSSLTLVALGPAFVFLWPKAGMVCLAVFLGLQIPLMGLAYPYAGLASRVIFLPAAALATDLLQFAGGLAWIMESLYKKMGSAGYLLRCGLNLLNPRALSHLIFFVTNQCGAHCPFCFNKEHPEVYLTAKDLSFAEIKNLTQGLAFLPVLTISGGEPFLREDIAKIIAQFYSSCQTRFVTIATNGQGTQKIVDAVQRIFRDCPDIKLAIAVAVNDIGPRHDKLVGVSGAFDQAAQTLDALARQKHRFPGLSITINTLCLPDNAPHLEKILSFFSQRFRYDRQSLNLLRNFQLSGQDPDFINADQYVSLLKNTNRHLRKNVPGFPQTIYNGFLSFCLENAQGIRQKKSIFRPCLAARKFAMITSEGCVYPCELLLEPLGHLKMENFQLLSILNRDTARHIRSRIKANNCRCLWPCAIIANSMCQVNGYPRLLR